MPIVCTGSDRSYTIQISGDVDHHGAQKLLWQLNEELSRHMPHTLTFDLAGVTFMDSSGIALLMRTKARMDEVGGSFAVVNVPSQATRMLYAAGINRFIQFN